MVKCWVDDPRFRKGISEAVFSRKCIYRQAVSNSSQSHLVINSCALHLRWPAESNGDGRWQALASWDARLKSGLYAHKEQLCPSFVTSHNVGIHKIRDIGLALFYGELHASNENKFSCHLTIWLSINPSIISNAPKWLCNWKPRQNDTEVGNVKPKESHK